MRIFNAMLASCHIPKLLTLGLVIAIPKGADKDLKNPSNYRGISLLSNVGKLFEKLLLEKILSHGISLNPLQGGFRPGYSAIHTAFIFRNCCTYVQQSLQTGTPIYGFRTLDHGDDFPFFVLWPVS